jgi:hypothetical protein
MTYIYRRTEAIDREPTAPYVFREIEPQPKKLPDKKKWRPELCGTTAGYAQHRRYDNEKCAACLDAQAKHSAAYRAKQKARQVLPKVRRNPSSIGSDNPIEEGVRNG